LILSDGGKAGPFFISRITVHRKHDPAATAETGWRGGTVKSDAAPFTEREAVKCGASDAFKRAAAKLGVGRNAYGMPTFWAACELKGQGDKQRAVMPRGMEERLRKMALAAIKSNTVTAEPIEA
ncbi:MAG: Rad52/Rad22 family DNA repair protein, partial [Armatimonadia bacterium]